MLHFVIGGREALRTGDGGGVISTQMQLGSVFLGVKRKGANWQEVAAGLDGWHVINAAASEDKEEGQGLRLGAEAARRGRAEAQDAAHTLEIRGVAVSVRGVDLMQKNGVDVRGGGGLRDGTEVAEGSEAAEFDNVLAAAGV